MKKFFTKIIRPGMLCFFMLIPGIQMNAQNPGKAIAWGQALRQESNWYASEEAVRIADNLLVFQHETGGWSKNIDMARVLSKNEMEKIKLEKQKSGTELSHAIMDNGATSAQMHFLAKVYEKTGYDRFKHSFLAGVNYYLKSQYKNGGWPQFYPIRKGYYQHITYNDNAMVNTMNLLRDIYSGADDFKSLHLGNDLKKQLQKAFDKGIQCIINTQIVVNGKPTVWCAQHDEKTLAPAKARSYELPSFSGAESAGIVFLLMSIESPSDEIIASIEGAVEWFRDHRIEGFKVTNTINTNGEKDRALVEDVNASPQWARFYDLETGKPFFCSRDGIKKSSIAEIDYERRNGYSWYTTAPEKVLDEFQKWKKLIKK